MPTVIADEDRVDVGMLGLEATHQWNDGIVLNTPLGSGWPRYKLTRITGLHSRPESDDPRDVLLGKIGEAARPTTLKGKTLSYEGEIQARSLASLRTAIADLEEGFWTTAEGVMTATPSPYYADGKEHTFAARCTALDIDEEQVFSPQHSPSAFCRNFVIGLRMSDPRFYLPAERSADADVTDGGHTYWRASATTLGRAPTDPLLSIGAPVDSGWQVKNLLTGRKLTVDVAVDAGHPVVIDFVARRVHSDVADLTNAVDGALSDWWDPDADGLAPAATQTIELSGAGMTADTTLNVAWRDANP